MCTTALAASPSCRFVFYLSSAHCWIAICISLFVDWESSCQRRLHNRKLIVPHIACAGFFVVK